MINQKMYDLGAAPSAIRELFNYGLEQKAKVGEENVYDYSIGNPSVPAPKAVKNSIKAHLEEDPVALHSYSAAGGLAAAREAVASFIEKHYGTKASASNVFLTHGASGAIDAAFCAITNPGDEIIVPSPFFPEYTTWIKTAECTEVQVPCLQPSFQLDIEAIGKAITAKTSAIVINSPNNPTGAIYPKESLEELAKVLETKEKEFGTEIYVICDEPYRAITYGAEVPWLPSIYDRTIVCYSYSKNLSLPGERIGWAFINDAMPNADEVSAAVAGAARALGHICAPVLFQKVMMDCLEEPADVEAYRENREILTKMLDELGFEYVEPEGAFYLWMKALEPSAQAFSDKARELNLLIVPSPSFGCDGWIRLSYCISKDTILNSRQAWEKLVAMYK